MVITFNNKALNDIANNVGLVIEEHNTDVTTKELEFLLEKVIAECATKIDEWTDSGRHKTFGDRLKAHFGVK